MLNLKDRCSVVMGTHTHACTNPTRRDQHAAKTVQRHLFCTAVAGRRGMTGQKNKNLMKIKNLPFTPGWMVYGSC